MKFSISVFLLFALRFFIFPVTATADVITSLPPGQGNGSSDTPYFYIRISGNTAQNHTAISVGSPDTPWQFYSLYAGKYITGIQSDRAFENHSDIDLHLIRSDEIYSTQSINLTGIESGCSISNQGHIHISATGGSAHGSPYPGGGASASASASGISGHVENNYGSITANAKGGMAVSDFHAFAVARARGIYGDVKNNYGSILVHADGGAAYATAYSYDDDESDDYPTVNNSFPDTEADAYAVGIQGNVTNNYGSITANATGGTTEHYAWAYGVGGNVENNHGDITVNANGGTLVPDTVNRVYTTAYGISEGAQNNYGNIKVTAKAGQYPVNTDTGFESGSANAYGIYYQHYQNTLDSRGLIQVETINADGSERIFAGTLDLPNGKRLTAYQVYNGRYAGNLNIKGYAIDFSLSQADLDQRYQGCIGGEKVSLTQDAVLYVHASGGINSDSRYTLPVLIESEVKDGAVSNNFANAQLWGTLSANYTAVMDTTSLGTQQIAFDYTPSVSTSLLGSQVRQSLLTQSDARIRQNLSARLMDSKDAGSVWWLENAPLYVSTDPGAPVTGQTPSNHSLFFLPYFTRSNNHSSDAGYDADIEGFSFNYDHRLSEKATAGLHLGYGQADVAYSGFGQSLKTDITDIYTAGGHTIARLNNFLFTGSATFFYSDTEYRDADPAYLERADFDGWGTSTRLDVGYILEAGNHRFMPVLGLSHLWQHQNSYTTDNQNNFNVTYGSVDDHEVNGICGLNWFTTIRQDQWFTRYHLGLELEHSFTDGKLSSTMGNGMSTVPVTSETDRNTIAISGAFEFGKKAWSLGGGYNGRFSSNKSDITFWVNTRYYF